MYSEKPPSRPEFFEPKESRQANATCGANASLTLGCSALGNGCVSPLTPRQFSTESCKGHTMYPESKRHRIFYLHPLLCGPTRSLIGETFSVSHVNARHPSCQPPWIVASIE